MADTASNETPNGTGTAGGTTGDKPNATQALKDNVIKFANDAGEKAKGYAEDGKSRAGTALDELAKMLQDAAGTVDEKVGEQYGQYARSAADAVANFSGALKEKQVDDIIDDAREFVKKSPAVAMNRNRAVLWVWACPAPSATSVSTNVRRSRRPNGTIAAPSRKATRHPHESSWGPVRTDANP